MTLFSIIRGPLWSQPRTINMVVIPIINPILTRIVDQSGNQNWHEHPEILRSSNRVISQGNMPDLGSGESDEMSGARLGQCLLSTAGT
jgi:hypothetical protein